MFFPKTPCFSSNRLFLRKGLDLRCSQSDLSLDLQKKLQEAQIGLDVIQGSHYLEGEAMELRGYWENQTMLRFHIFCLCSPLLGKMIQFDRHIFSDGLVQPPPRHGKYESFPLNSPLLCCGNRMTFSCVSKTLKPKNNYVCIRDI